MSSEKVNSFSSWRLVCLFLKPIGLAFYSIDDKKQILKTSIWDYFHITIKVLVAILFIWLYYGYARIRNYKSGAKMSILDEVWKHQYKVQLYLSVVLIIYNFIQRKRVESFLKKLSKFDSSMVNMGWKQNIDKLKLWRLAILLAFPVLLIIGIYPLMFLSGDIDMDLGQSYFNIINLTFYIYMMELYYLVVMQFVLCTDHVNRRLMSLKRNLR
jgi:hypothetical protein